MQELLEDTPIHTPRISEIMKERIRNEKLAEANSHERELQRYGEIYCDRCHQYKSGKGARHGKAMEASGMSGGSNTYYGSVGLTKRTRGPRVGMSHNTGRTYYKAVAYSICADCDALEDRIDNRPQLWINVSLLFSFIVLIETFLLPIYALFNWNIMTGILCGIIYLGSWTIYSYTDKRDERLKRDICNE